MRKYITVLLIVVFIVPSIAFASWWNPFSWKVFSFLTKNNQNLKIEEVNKTSSPSTASEIEVLEKRLAELKNQQLESTLSNKATTAIEDKAALIAEIKAQVTSELKAKAKEEAIANREKTLSEKVGVSRESLAVCIKNTDTNALQSKISLSVENAMKALGNQRGTPYAVVVGSNGIRTEIMGALPYESVKKTIDDVLSGVVSQAYKGDVVVIETGDHIMGSLNAKVKIIEYSDLECPYCKTFHETLKRVVSESNGNVSWVYRHWPIHQGSFEKLVASECVAKIKDNDAFWKYIDLLFGLLNEASKNSITGKL